MLNSLLINNPLMIKRVLIHKFKKIQMLLDFNRINYSYLAISRITISHKENQ